MKWFNREKKKMLDDNVQALAETPKPTERKIINERAKEHFNQKQSFEKDRVSFYKTLSKISFGVGGIGALIGLAGVVAVAGLTPLKSTEPYVIRVDNNTGFTDIVKPISNSSQTTYGEELDKYWLSKFVIERESYDWQLVQNSYNAVELMTTPQVFNEYKAYITSKVSPVNLLKQNKKIKVRVLSISFINGVGQVRFSKQVLTASGDPDSVIPTTYWLASIPFDYKHEIKLEQQRLINPLGFQALSYRADPETNLSEK
ncbi:conjugal transfer protein TraG [Rodentibacter caecimuris]|uniref:Conjugal transfer protein TraG n=1 Tax=Rodentibacter caecimuris TaxID=1796644 RepID=A0A1V3KJQ0_9PAST|nr:type IV secretion system protein [Rodentibacter heylii]OOF77864.1 conjugal transfer protein TraG [Rodentibacter heylii]